MKPFTYLIGWPDHNLFYYGVRFRRNCDPSELWTTYFTSSVHVARTREALGEPTLIQVRREFDSNDAARSWEARVLRRLHVRKDPRFLNRCELPAPPSDKHPDHVEAIAMKLRGKKRTPEQRARIGAGMSGISTPKSEEHKRKIGDANRGKQKPEGFGAAVSARMKDRVQSEEERAKRKASLTGKPKSAAHIAAVVEAKKRKALERALLSA